MKTLIIIMVFIGGIHYGYKHYFEPNFVATEVCPGCDGTGTLWSGSKYFATGRACNFCNGNKKVPLVRIKEIEEAVKGRKGVDIINSPSVYLNQ